MKKHVRISEFAEVLYPDGAYIVCDCVVTHNRFEVKHEVWRISIRQNTAKAAQYIADALDCEGWSYQTCWSPLHARPQQLPTVAFTAHGQMLD